jgi:hypothetical protein
MSVSREYLGDARTHHPGANDGNSFHHLMTTRYIYDNDYTRAAARRALR